MTSLDLDSQIHLLSRVQFLTRFGSHLIQISGDAGAGKTWLAQRYLEQWADADGSQARQALLMCHPAQNDSQHRSILLNQLIPNAVFNDSDPLQQSLERLLEGKPAELLLVIDDAHLLSPALIGELWALVMKAQQASGWQINVLLFSQTGQLTKALRQVSHGQGQSPLELEIPALSEAEVQTFMELVLASHFLDANQRRALKAQAAEVAPTPGALMTLDHTEISKMASSSSRTFSPMSLLLLLIVLIGAASVFWFLPSDDAKAPQQSAAERDAAPALDETLAQSGNALVVNETVSSEGVPETVPETKVTLEQPTVAIETETTTDATVAAARAPTTENTDALPAPVQLEGLTVGRSSESAKRVVVPSDVVDAMITEQETGGSGELAVASQSDLKAAIDEVLATDPQGRADSEGSTDVTGVAAPAEQPASVSPPPLASLQAEMADDMDTLKAVNSRHYALQLAAMHSLEATRSFLEEYGVKETAQVYQTQRQGVRWYIVVTGNYASVAAARRAQAQLPDKVQSVQPWVKSYTQIHREIERAQ
ncbi:hypothetical protein EA58_15925 [Photobacterium galatheae]|uniref:SPOR domain-containing protein n=1 Tax=Photobacterium galatheae TaxID=1654360 RepID=A0A066RJT9_9GAMM|nr:hypothetical protein EA58_15925 [Photobacterium galatheae]